MRRLLIDLGNSRLKWAWLAEDALSPSGAAVHRGQDMAAVLAQAWAGQEAPASLHGAGVAPRALRQAVDDWASRHWGREVDWVETQADYRGLRNGYHEPARLGIDRWLAMVAAWRRHQAAACVVDCGSAVTVDILDDSGGHLGGWIAPGLQLMRTALLEGTDLPPAQGEAKGEAGRDTASAILSGTLLAAVGLVDQALQLGPEGSRLLLTGGDASELARQLRHPHEICPDLVLEGLADVVKGA
jgi:type III pantothenate kinase